MRGKFRFTKLLPLAAIIAALAITAATSWHYVSRGDDANGIAFCDLPDGCDSPSYALSARSADEELARKHAPIVYLPPLATGCDAAGSAIRPIPVETVLGNREVVLRKLGDPEFAILAPTVADLAKEGAKYFDAYVDLPGDPRRSSCNTNSTPPASPKASRTSPTPAFWKPMTPSSSSTGFSTTSTTGTTATKPTGSSSSSPSTPSLLNAPS